MRKLLLISIMLSSALSCNVFAAEKWAGFYVGAELGYVDGDDEGKEYDLDGSFNGWVQNPQPDGTSLGIRGGYNWLITDKVIVGLEAGYNKYNAKDDYYQIDTFYGGDCDPGTDCEFKTEIDQSYSLLGRLGYLVNNKTLVYVIGGYTKAKIKRTIIDGWFLVGSDKHDDWQSGSTLGVGAEYQLNNSFSAKLEYRYSDLGKESINTPAYGGQIEKHEYDQNEITIGLIYHF